jgi:ferrous iron transport protein B
VAAAAIAAPLRLALVGSPNSGKTSLFNALTGGREKVGNYPGVTVERIEGKVKIEGKTVEVTDIPGLYSLRAVSADELVAYQELKNAGPDEVIVFVLDAVNFDRSLFLFSQVVEFGRRIVVALTLTDIAAKEGKTFDAAALSELLGCPVVPVVSHKNIGLTELKSAVARAVAPEIDLGFPEIVREGVEELRTLDSLRNVPELELRDALLMEDPARLEERGEDAAREIHLVRERLLGAGIQGRTLDAQTRYSWAAMVGRRGVKGTSNARNNVTAKIDAVLTHRVFGMIIFLGIMYLVFQSIYTFATPLMDGIENLFGMLGEWIGPRLEGTPVIQSLIVDGIIGGVGSAIVFLPQILILFALIAILEGSGYLARAAFMMDRVLGWCGLNGRAFIPLLSSFACAIPGVMAARVMPDPKARLATILVAPLMSCSARLPVYIVVIGAVVEPKFGPVWAGFALFAMHFVGLLAAIPVAWILNRRILKGRNLPFMMDLPRYQWPKWRDVLLMVVNRGKVFVTTAGTIIFAMSVVIWALTYFPRFEGAPAQTADWTVERQQVWQQEKQMENSYLGQFGRSVAPVFEPAGFDWRMTTAILAAFPAREVVVSALGILFMQGDEAEEDGIREAMVKAKRPDGTPLINFWNAMGLMVFFALCAQCMATLAAIKREANSWKWAGFAFVYMTTLAYVFAVLIYQIGSRIGS